MLVLLLMFISMFVSLFGVINNVYGTIKLMLLSMSYCCFHVIFTSVLFVNVMLIFIIVNVISLFS